MNPNRINLFLVFGFFCLTVSACVFGPLKEYKKVEVDPGDAKPNASFVVEIRTAWTTTNKNADEMCIEISQEALWNRGDYTKELTRLYSQ